MNLSKGAGKQERGGVQAFVSTTPTPLSSYPAVRSWGIRDWLVIITLAMLVLLFHWRLITPNMADRQSYLPGDFAYQFWAFSTFEARELSQGRLPLWNPYTYAGSPFWADVQSAVFYPFSLLTIILSSFNDGELSIFALEIEAILHFWLAGCFMYLFVRRITQNRAAGFISALVFTFGGYLTGYPAQQLAVLEVDIWLPLILFFIDRALLDRQLGQGATLRITPRWLDVYLAGASWGIAILAGHPQSWMLVAYTFIAYYVYLRLGVVSVTPNPNPQNQILSGLLPLIYIMLIGLALSAVQLLPAIEYTRLSVRAEGIYEAMAGGFPLHDPVQLLLPGVVSLYSPLYVGILGLLLVILALQFNRDRGVLFWSIWGIIAFLISFGGETFLYSPLYMVAPGFSIFRGQERWAFAVALSLAVLAGYGMHGLLLLRQYDAIKLRGFQRGVSWLLAGAIGLVFIFFFGLNDTGWSADNAFYGLLNQAIFLALLLVLSVIVIRVVIKPSTSSTVAIMSISAIILFDLFSTNWQTNLYAQPPEWHTQKPAVIAALEADAMGSQMPYRVYNEFRLYDNYGLPFQLQDLWGASPLRLQTYDRFIAPPMLIERAWAMLNVRYVITWRAELFVPSTVLYQEPALDGITYLHRLETVGPRAWLVHQAELMPESAMVAHMTESDFDHQQTVLLPSETVVSLATPDNNEELVDVIAYTPNQLTLQVDAASDGILVISEIYYPGWQATIDGQSTSILRANSTLRALSISAGTHEVVLTFVPWTFYIGAAVSAVTMFGLFGALLASLMRHKREHHEGTYDELRIENQQ